MFARYVAGMNTLIMPAISALFFVRLSAVYSHDRRILILFGSCWLCVLGVFIFDTTTVLSRYSSNSLSHECFVFTHIDAWGYIASGIFDTLMYFAISWRLATFSTTGGWISQARSFVTGDGLGWLSKILLRSGQVYYL
jgi:hypothetical protein